GGGMRGPDRRHGGGKDRGPPRVRGARAAPRGPGSVRRPVARRPRSPPHRRARAGSRSRGSTGVPIAERPREPRDGGPVARCARRAPRDSGGGVRSPPTAQGARAPGCWHALRRRAADAGDRRGAQGAPALASAGRAVTGSRPARSPEHPSNRRDGQSAGDYNPPRGAERATRTRSLSPRLRRRERRRHAGRLARGAPSLGPRPPGLPGNVTVDLNASADRPSLTANATGAQRALIALAATAGSGANLSEVLERVARAAATLVPGSL